VKDRRESGTEWKSIKDAPPPEFTPLYLFYPKLKKSFIGMALHMKDDLTFGLLPQHSLPEYYRARRQKPRQWRYVLPSAPAPKGRQKRLSRLSPEAFFVDRTNTTPSQEPNLERRAANLTRP
jgi:hypothetical protein